MLNQAVAQMAVTTDGRPIDPDRQANLAQPCHGAPCLGSRFETSRLCVDLNTASPFAVNFRTTRTTFSLNLAARDDEIALDSDQFRERRIQPGTITLTPKDCTIKARSGATDAEFLAFHVADDLMAEALEDVGLNFCDLRSVSGLSHPDFQSLGAAMRSFMLSNQKSELYGEAIGVATVLAAANAFARGETNTSTGQIPKAKLDALLERIEADLEEPLTVPSLADQVGLPLYRFIRDFKATMGQSPYQYILERRINLARKMLECGRESLAEISFAAGFSSQAHMTSLFKRRLGVTPGHYRRSHGSQHLN